MQVVIQRGSGAVFTLQQLRQVEFVGARCEVGDHVVAAVALEPLEGVGAAAAGQGVVAQAADQEVVTALALEHVIAQATGDDVAVVVAGQFVVEVGADEVFDGGQGVGAGAKSVLRTARAQVDRDS
ncbi:hypothetical protein D3C86_1090420 [compost metagenome]